jgi:BRCT domain type II-containing protein
MYASIVISDRSYQYLVDEVRMSLPNKRHAEKRTLAVTHFKTTTAHISNSSSNDDA